MGVIIQLPSAIYACARAMGMGKRKYSNDRRKLNRKLKKAGIKFEWNYLYDGYQWHFPQFPAGDVIIHSFSHYSKDGCYESMGMPWDDDDVTTLTAKQLIEAMKEELKK